VCSSSWAWKACGATRCDGAARQTSDETDRRPHLPRQHAQRRQAPHPVRIIDRSDLQGKAGKSNEFDKMVELQETRSSSITRPAPGGRVIPTCRFCSNTVLVGQLATAVMSGTTPIRPAQCRPLDRKPLGRESARGVRSQDVRCDQSSDRSSPLSLTCDVPLYQELLPACGHPRQPSPLAHEWRQPALRQIKSMACIPR
jgi:hypothetical protein